jgi:hypothetical protein
MQVLFWRQLALTVCCALAAGPVLALGGGTAAVTADAPMLERLVFIRHGEKPVQSMGQLSCQGLNRALALPAVLAAKYGRPDFIFAPDPRQDAEKSRQGMADYVRPLATIEPTAIQLGMPVNTQYNTAQSMDMHDQLLTPAYWNATVFVAWEHNLIEFMVRDLISNYGLDPTQPVPKWQGGDYDSLYVVELNHTLGKTTATFRIDHEGLDGQSMNCPGATPAAAIPTSATVPVAVPAALAVPASASAVAPVAVPVASGPATPGTPADDAGRKAVPVLIDASGQPVLKPAMP